MAKKCTMQPVSGQKAGASEDTYHFLAGGIGGTNPARATTGRAARGIARHMAEAYTADKLCPIYYMRSTWTIPDLLQRGRAEPQIFEVPSLYCASSAKG